MTNKILAIKTTDGQYQPLAWTPRKLSDKEVRRMTGKFRNDSDFDKGVLMESRRLYRDFREYVNLLPRV